MKPFLGNFYRQLAIFIWSHCMWHLFSVYLWFCSSYHPPSRYASVILSMPRYVESNYKYMRLRISGPCAPLILRTMYLSFHLNITLSFYKRYLFVGMYLTLQFCLADNQTTYTIQSIKREIGIVGFCSFVTLYNCLISTDIKHFGPLYYVHFEVLYMLHRLST